MTVRELERAQARYLPKENLTAYAGQWVALRDGHVIAANSDPIALRDNAAVTEEDMLLPVPASGEAVFFLS